jgi:hypothetical protein
MGKQKQQQRGRQATQAKKPHASKHAPLKASGRAGGSKQRPHQQQRPPAPAAAAAAGAGSKAKQAAAAASLRAQLGRQGLAAILASDAALLAEAGVHVGKQRRGEEQPAAAVAPPPAAPPTGVQPPPAPRPAPAPDMGAVLESLGALSASHNEV